VARANPTTDQLIAESRRIQEMLHRTADKAADLFDRLCQEAENLREEAGLPPREDGDDRDDRV